MNIIIHKFPTLEEGRERLEEVYCGMMSKYRSGALDFEELDWFDWANTVLSSSETTSY